MEHRVWHSGQAGVPVVSLLRIGRNRPCGTPLIALYKDRNAQLDERMKNLRSNSGFVNEGREVMVVCHQTDTPTGGSVGFGWPQDKCHFFYMWQHAIGQLYYT